MAEGTAELVDVFPQTNRALFSQPANSIDGGIFVLSSQQNYMLGVLYFESSQQTNCLQRIESDVNVVPQKHILIALHLMVVRKPEVFEQSQQVKEPSIDAPENLNRRSHSHQTRLVEHQLRSLLAQTHNFILLEGKQRRIQRFLLLESKQGLQNSLGELD